MWRALREEGGAPRGSAALRRIWCSEKDPTFIGSSSQRIQLSEEDLALGEESSSKSRVQHLEDLALRGSNSWEGLAFRGCNLEEDPAPGGGSSTQRSTWCSEDPTLGGGSGTKRIQLSEDTTLGRASCQRIQLLECLALGGGSSAPPMISQPPGWDDPCAGAQ